MAKRKTYTQAELFRKAERWQKMTATGSPQNRHHDQHRRVVEQDFRQARLGLQKAERLGHAPDKTYPDRAEFRHSEDNSAAHLKASISGSSVTVIIDGGKFLLGTWQGVYFCEFDPPRNRKFYVKIIES
jgi:hypothetical protein